MIRGSYEYNFEPTLDTEPDEVTVEVKYTFYEGVRSTNCEPPEPPTLELTEACIVHPLHIAYRDAFEYMAHQDVDLCDVEQEIWDLLGSGV